MSEINELLVQKAEEIDITIEVYEELNKFIKQLQEKYGDTWEIYPQGSVRLGTVIQNPKQNNHKDYDIDLVAYNTNIKYVDNINKSEDFKMLADPEKMEIKQRREEKKPCWTIYLDGGLSIDITPSINDPDKKDKSEKMTRTEDFEKYDWEDSNPKGYYYWFKGINQEVYKKAYEQLRLERGSESNIYKPLVRTNLQRSIQILKYLRDEHFNARDDKEYKPISIIITTLTTQIFKYLNCNASIEQVVKKFIEVMNLVKENKRYGIESFSESKIKVLDPIKEFYMENDIWYIPNPTDKNENFAKKWNKGEEGKKRVEAFFAWVKVLEDIFSSEEKLDDFLYPPKKEVCQSKPYAE